MELFWVYFLKNEETGRFYIGSTSNLKKRYRRHLSELAKNSHHCKTLQDLYNNGHSFHLMDITLYNQTRKDAYDLEQKLIDRFKDTGLLLNIGLGAVGGDNITRNPDKDLIITKIRDFNTKRLSLLNEEDKKRIYGRSGSLNAMFGKHHTEEVKQRISSVNKGRKRPPGYVQVVTDKQRAMASARGKLKIGKLNPFYGKTHTEETKKKLRESHLGFKPRNSVPLSVDKVSYSSYKEASLALSIPVVTIRHRVLSKNPKFTNYILLKNKSPTTIEKQQTS